jgi:hypothetical protein
MNKIGAKLVGMLGIVAFFALIIFVFAHLPTFSASIGALIGPSLSRVDRTIITGCASTMGNDELSWADKATRLVAMHCERYSDRQIMQVNRDVEKCINEKAALGDAIVDHCIDAARGFVAP